MPGDQPELGDRRRVMLARPSNMRDLGGLPVRGGIVRRCAVFRAGGLHHLEENDLRIVGALGLRTLIDLRSGPELELHGEPPAELAARRVHLPMIPDVWDLRPLDRAETVEAYLLERYLEMLELGRDAIRRTLHLMLDPGSYPVGLFCAAGKDRTGVMTAVLLRLLGADDATIVADYALSGPELARLLSDVGDREGWSERMAGGSPRLLQAPAPVMDSFLVRLPGEERLVDDFDLVAGAPATLRALLVTADAEAAK